MGYKGVTCESGCSEKPISRFVYMVVLTRKELIQGRKCVSIALVMCIESVDMVGKLMSKGVAAIS